MDGQSRPPDVVFSTDLRKGTSVRLELSPHPEPTKVILHRGKRKRSFPLRQITVIRFTKRHNDIYNVSDELISSSVSYSGEICMGSLSVDTSEGPGDYGWENACRAWQEALRPLGIRVEIVDSGGSLWWH